jgi:hypothetical protein
MSIATSATADLDYVAANSDSGNPDGFPFSSSERWPNKLPAGAPSVLAQALPSARQEQDRSCSNMAAVEANSVEDGGRTAHRPPRWEPPVPLTNTFGEKGIAPGETAAAMCSTQWSIGSSSGGWGGGGQPQGSGASVMEATPAAPSTPVAEAMRIVCNHSTPGGQDSSIDCSVTGQDIRAPSGAHKSNRLPNILSSTDQPANGNGAWAMVLAAPSLREAAAVDPINLPALPAEFSVQPSMLQAAPRGSHGVGGGAWRATAAADSLRVRTWDDADKSLLKGCPAQMPLWRAMT